MKPHPTSIEGLTVFESSVLGDARGSFMRLYCDSFVPMPVVQANRSLTAEKGSLRGLHFQRAPALEPKLVRCTQGRVFDVAVDLRAGSPTFLKHFSIELDADKGLALFIPGGFAHGFQTLTDDCEMIYFHGAAYSKEHEGGLRFDDPALGIAWPLPPGTMSPRDQGFAPIGPDFKGVA